MKNTVITFFILMVALFSLNLNAQEYSESEAPCGMILSADGGSNVFPYSIDENSSEICSNDISYRMLHMIFGASIDTDLSKSLFYLLHEPDDGTVLISEISPVGRSIQSLYQALNTVFFTIFVFAVSYQTIRYVLITQTSGQFLGDKSNAAGQGAKKSAEVAINAVFLILLVTPVGSLLFVQLIIMLLAVIGIKLANFFLSTFLFNVQTETTNVQISDDLLFKNAEFYSSNFVSGKMCEIQTQQAVMSEYFVSGTEYSGNGWFGWLPFVDGVHRLEVFQECNTYSDTFGMNSKGLLTSISSEIKHNRCWFNGNNFLSRTRSSGNYGANHKCFELNFSVPDSNHFDKVVSSKPAKKRKEEIYKEVKKSNNLFYRNYAFKNIKDKVLTSSFITQYDNIMSDTDMDISEKENLVIALLNEQAATFKDENIIRHIYDGNKISATDRSGGLLLMDINDTLEIGNNTEVFNLIYLSHLFAMNKALGGYIDENVDSEYKAGLFSINSLFQTGNKYNRDIKKYEDTAKFTGLEHIRDYSINKSADSYMRAHCANLMIGLDERNYNLINNSSTYYSNSLTNSNFDYKIKGKELGYTECIKFIASGRGKEHLGIEHYLFGSQGLPFSNDLINVKISELQEIVADNSEFLTSYVQDNLRAAERYRGHITAYNYIVKKAFADSLALELKRNADFKILAQSRDQGWAGLGSMMLAISSEQSLAVSMTDGLISTGRATASAINISDGGGVSFVNPEVFMTKNGDFAEGLSQNTYLNYLVPLTVASSLLTGSSNDASAQHDQESMELGLIQRMMTSIFDFLFETPLLYLKMGGGLDVGSSIIEGLESCSQTADCYPKLSHPVNATIMFGQSLISNSVTILLVIMMLEVIIDLITAVVGSSAGGESTSAKSGNFIKKMIPPPFSIILFVVKFVGAALKVIFSLIKPLIWLMIFAGIMTGYIMPTIPYLMTIMVVLGWYLSIFMITVAIPISILVMSRLRDDGQTQLNFEYLWQRLGIVVLKPPLITIAIIFAWILVNVSIYYINTTAFSVFAIGLSSPGIIMSFMSTFLTYFIYAMIIYFIMQHAFFIILKFSDEVLAAIGLSTTGDEGMYSTLSVERMLAGQTIQGTLREVVNTGEVKLKKGAQGQVNNIHNRFRNKIKTEGGNELNQNSKGSSQEKPSEGGKPSGNLANKIKDDKNG